LVGVLFELMGTSMPSRPIFSHPRFIGRFHFNGQQGDLLRSAKLGRVSFGGALRLSSGRYIPVLRLGLGLQGASHTAEMEVGGVRMAGPEVEFEFNPLWFFGAGMDTRLGSHLVAGVGLLVEQLVGSSSRSLEAGVHLGYSWKGASSSGL
jgi:hypothetical protein